jgi:hypothetical protein
MNETEAERSDLQLITIGYVEIDMRRRHPLVHRHLRAGQFPQIPYASTMVRVGMGVDRQLQLKPMIREHAEVAIDAFFDRVDKHTLASFFAREKVGLTA